MSVDHVPTSLRLIQNKRQGPLVSYCGCPLLGMGRKVLERLIEEQGVIPIPWVDGVFKQEVHDKQHNEESKKELKGEEPL